MLYLRQIVMMVVTLYTSRVVLEALGESDYGIYSVVGSVVAMFSVISGSLVAAISRFITFEIGTGNLARLRRVFSTSVTIQLLLALVVVVLIESIAPWFISSKMNISPDRIAAAQAVLHLSMAAFVLNLVSVPYTAAIIAHERMTAFAYISILEAVLKLAAVLLLVVFGGDKLVVYALLLLIVAAMVRLIYGIYCKRNFEECSYSFILDRGLFGEMLSFSGWNFIGASSGVLRDQGVNIVLNIVYGTVVNAARGIAMQVNTTLYNLASNVVMASNPQITKSYAKGDMTRMMTLVFNSARYCYFLLLIMALPLIVLAPEVLALWLVEVPEYTVAFVRLILVYLLVESVSLPLITAMLATGRIKRYQIIVGGIQLLNLPLAYLVLWLGYSPESTVWVAIVISVVCFLARMVLLRSMVGLDAGAFFRSVISRIVIVTLCSATLSWGICYVLPTSYFVILIVSVLSVGATTYFVGLKGEERQTIKTYLKR